MNFKDAFIFLQERDNFLITIHMNPDADATGSARAVLCYLESIGKTATVVTSDAISEKLAFISDGGGFELYNSSIQPDDFDAVIMLDSPSKSRAGVVESLMPEAKPTLNIDHHEDNELFGTCNIVDTDASSTSQLVAMLLQSNGVQPAIRAATTLYAGIYSDTGGFRFDKTNGTVLRIAAWLADCGAEIEQAVRELYFKENMATIKGMGAMMESVELLDGGKIGVAYIRHELLSKPDMVGLDTDGFANKILSIRGVETAFLIKENSKSVCRINLRTESDVISMNTLAKQFNGGGHPKASGATIYETPDVAKQMLVKAFTKLEESAVL